VQARPLIRAVAAVALVGGVLLLARPATVWDLLRRTDPVHLGLAAAGFAAACCLRGLRLTLLLPPSRLGWGRATLVATAAQAAAQFTPARAGELALPLLLRRAAVWELEAGIGTLLAARALDLAAVGLWAGAALLALHGPAEPLALLAAAALVVPALLLPFTLAAADALATRLLAPRGAAGRRWTRRLRRLRGALSQLRSRPGRLIGAVACSLATWGCIWVYTWLLLVAMGYRWAFQMVVAGSAGALLAAFVPLSLVASLGTLEAGWTASFSALGVPVDQAAASGLAAHLWALVLAAVFGASAAGVLTRRKRPVEADHSQV